MSKYKITEYRGFDISYDDNRDKFECVIAEQTRTSGAIDKLKKVIDKWFDEAGQCTPIDVFLLADKCKLVGVHGNGNLIIEHEGKRLQVSEWKSKSVYDGTSENEARLRAVATIDDRIDELRGNRTTLTDALTQTEVKAFKEKWGK